jgi:hypothetical protein
MTVQYTEPASVTGIKTAEAPVSGRTVSGYGGRVPTSHMVQYLGAWRRVYAMAYGNGASLYIRVAGEPVHLDADTLSQLGTEGGE